MKDPHVINRFAVIPASLCMFIASPLLAEVPPIEKIAPENSIIVIGAKNTKQAMENVKKTGLWAMWQSDKMVALRADAMKEMEEGIKKAMQELGVDEDSLTYPSGPAGLAFFTVPDPDLGTPEISMLLFADYGDAAEKTDKLIHAALDKGAKDGELEFEEKDVAGRQVVMIDLSKMQPKEEPKEDAGFNPLPMPDPEKMIKGMTKMNYVRDGSTLLLSSDMTALTDALDAIDGKGDAGGKFAAREDFQNTVSQLGGENDAYAVVLTRDVMDLLGEGGQMMMMLRPTVRTLTGEVAGYAAGARFDTGTAMVEETLGIYMPNGKKGLTDLLDKPAPRADIPAFVAADSTSYMAANFDFSGVMNVLKAVVNSNPMLAAQGSEALAQIEPMATPILNSLGTKVVSASGKDSGVMALECKDPQGFENGFAGLAAKGGLESRDFLGQRIYTMKEGMADMLPMGVGGEGGPVSIGIGGGYVFIGGTPGVEQALRSTGAANAANLSKDETFQKAVAALGNDPVVAWGYSDLVATIESTMKARQEAMKQAVADAKEFDPDLAAEMEKELAAAGKLSEQIDPAFLKQYIGPAVWQMRSTDKGFVMNGYILPAK